MDSILLSIKKNLGLESTYTHFDADIITYINAVLLTINQINVGPSTGFIITGETEKWNDLLGIRKDIEAVKTLITLKVRLMFDPPSSSFVIESINRQITELEWRINVQTTPSTEVIV